MAMAKRNGSNTVNKNGNVVKLSQIAGASEENGGGPMNYSELQQKLKS